MSFRFALEAVLRLRRNLERQQELLLYKANQEVSRLKRRIEEVDSGIVENLRQRSIQLHTGMTAAELHFRLLCDETLLKSRADLQKRLNNAARARDSQAVSYRRARQRREAVETLRQHQLQLYRQHEARQDQRRADDLFLLRRSYRQSG